MTSVSTPPMSLAWRKKIGVPCAPIRVGPRMRDPLPSNQARATCDSCRVTLFARMFSIVPVNGNPPGDVLSPFP